MFTRSSYLQLHDCNDYFKIFELPKDKRMIILYAVPIPLWRMLGKENRYFYTRQPNNNDLWNYHTF